VGGVDEDAGGAVAEGDFVGDGAGGGVEDDEVGGDKEGDEDVLAVGCELQAVGAADVIKSASLGGGLLMKGSGCPVTLESAIR
jgi:hypothetical protein